VFPPEALIASPEDAERRPDGAGPPRVPPRFRPRPPRGLSEGEAAAENFMNGKMKRFVAFFVLLLLGVGSCRAGLRVPQIIGDAMVLQQRSDAVLWGWADPGARITVAASWSDARAEARADAAGRWRVAVATPAAGDTPYRVTVSDGRDSLVFNDVLIGEVWFCSGQSNMEMPLDGFRNQPVADAREVLVRANGFTGIRMATVPHAMAGEPQQEVGGAWQRCTTETAHRFSATAFYFARLVNEVLGVPVGIIQCSWGGSKVEGWMPRELLAGYPDVDPEDATREGVFDNQRPMIMYNAMLYPLHDYTIRGFIWYQGCSNVGAHAVYAERQAAMVAHWRALWGLGELPFYFVEIAPFRYGGGRDDGAFLREAQHRAAELIPSSGIVSTSDLVMPYEQGCIHPTRKREVGERLACMALNRTYGFSGIACDDPVFREMEHCDDGSVILSFDHLGEGFMFGGRPVEGFEVAGEDRVFHPAKAGIYWAEMRIRLAHPDGVPVAAVRYCFHDWSPSTLRNCLGLPLVPFRTDDWEQ